MNWFRQRLARTRDAVYDSIVPKTLGFGVVSREKIISDHTTNLASELHGEQKCILVMDGTYIFIEKSQNYKLARSTFCVHKKRHLVKPMITCTTTGHIISVDGPYLANGRNSDGKILISMLGKKDSPLNKLLEHADVIIADRGFRDARAAAKAKQVCMHLPTLSKAPTTRELNKSRCVTKLR
jgi:hypothetical protein